MQGHRRVPLAECMAHRPSWRVPLRPDLGLCDGDFGRSAPLRERRAETGASVVEFALVLPLLVCLLLGIFTGGIALNQKAAVSSGVREGSLRRHLARGEPSCTSGPQTMACWLSEWRM